MKYSSFLCLALVLEMFSGPSGYYHYYSYSTEQNNINIKSILTVKLDFTYLNLESKTWLEIYFQWDG